MAKFRDEDGRLFDTDKAKRSWDEDTRWDGRNHISVATGSQWDHETLYLSSKGTYYVVAESQWQGAKPSVRVMDESEAAAWIEANGHELPVGLSSQAE